MTGKDRRRGRKDVRVITQCCFLLPRVDIISFFDSLTSVINGFDKDGRPIIYMNPARQNTESSPRQLRHLVWCL